MITRRQALIGGGALGIAGAATALGLALRGRGEPTLVHAEPVATTPGLPDDPAHGEALVERAIAALRSAGTFVPGSDCAPTGLSERALATLALPGGATLPASLRAWLAFDVTYTRWFTDLCKPSFPELGLVDALVYAGAPRSTVYAFAGLERETLRGKCLPFPFGDVSRCVLYLGATDARGEHPVLLFDWDDVPYVALDAPGVDVYFARLARIVNEPKGGWKDDPTYAARAESAITSVFRAAAPPDYGAPGFTLPRAEDEPSQADIERETASTGIPILPDGAPVPPGAKVRVVTNPFTKKRERWVSYPSKKPSCPKTCE